MNRLLKATLFVKRKSFHLFGHISGLRLTRDVWGCCFVVTFVACCGSPVFGKEGDKGAEHQTQYERNSQIKLDVGANAAGLLVLMDNAGWHCS